MFKYLGMSDEVSVCDCCGKSDLKRTVAFDRDGEIFHYGTTCAAKNTDKPVKVWQTEDEIAYKGRLYDAVIVYRQSEECRAKEARFALRSVQRVPVGRASADFVRDVCDAADAKVALIAAAHNVRRWVAIQSPIR